VESLVLKAGPETTLPFFSLEQVIDKQFNLNYFLPSIISHCEAALKPLWQSIFSASPLFHHEDASILNAPAIAPKTTSNKFKNIFLHYMAFAENILIKS